MSQHSDPYQHHPELRGKITDPMTSFFRDFRVESVLDDHPELAYALEFLISDEARDANRAATLSTLPDGDLWVFAYGSLMWDPALRFTKVRRAHAPRHTRRFILKEVLGGRGSPEAPGLVAALEKPDSSGAIT